MRMYKIKLNNSSYDVTIKKSSPQNIVAEVNGKEYLVNVDGVKHVASPGEVVEKDTAKPVPTPSHQTPTKAKENTKVVSSDEGKIYAPIPGQIKGIFVKVGDTITTGQKVLVMEAMKMENVISSTLDGVITEIHVGDGDTVDHGQLLIEIGD